MIHPSSIGRREIGPETLSRYRTNGWWTDRTLLDDFLAVAATRPDAEAIVSYRSGGGDDDRRTYGALAELSRQVAAALIDLGVGKGDVVSVQLPNGWEFPAVVFGILRVGAVVSPLVPIFRHRELEFILGRTESSVVFVPDVWRNVDYAAMAIEVRERLESLRHVVVVGGHDPRPETIDFAAEVVGRDRQGDAALATELEARRPAADDLCLIQFTSGTTGEPKGVLHSHNTLRSGCRAVDEIFGLTGDDVCFMASTLAHQTGFGYGLMKPLGMGMRVVYQDVWDAAGCAAAIATERVTWTVSATTFAIDLIAAQQRQPRNLESFRYFICGGAPIPPKVVEDARTVLGAELVAVWGMTENMIVTTTRPGDAVELVSDSDGTPVDYMEIRIVDDDGRPVAVGQAGNLQVRGPSQTLGYFRRPDLYEAALRDGDWFDTGDVARLRPDGGIRIVGRTKDLIIRGGENIPVAEVEALLIRHVAVREVAVVGVADERLGERTCAVITTDGPAPSLRDLTEHLERAGMAKPFWPERLEVVDEMPRTPSGKVQKFKLRDRLQAARA
jgi:cyclohexanecarboxylate-CoA ligase